MDASVQIPPAVAQPLLRGEPTKVLVRLQRERGELPQSLNDRRHLLKQRSAAWTDRADEFVRDLPLGARFERTYRHTAVVVVEVRDLQTAYELANRPGVVSLEPDTQHELFLTQSLDLIDQPEVEALGSMGAGVAVAVLDTGANYAHADLGSCSAVATPASTCRVIYAQDFATQDNSLDASGHGTNVSSIVAAVAPEADIIALDVFDGSTASTSVILSAMDWVIDNQELYNIASINLSLGSGSYTEACTDSFTDTIDDARTAGVSVVVASGNNAYDDAVSSPACNAASIAVGAVYDSNVGAMNWSGCSDATTAADQVTCFSNSADILDLVAPGALVTAGGYTMGGTSQAAPHVAGALAVLRGADPSSSIDDLEDRVLTSGTTVTDSRNSLEFPRLDLLTAVESTPVSGTVVINGGAYATTSPSVTLTLDSDQAAEVCLSNTTTCTAWQTYAAELPWTTTSGAGTKTVYATFRDGSQVTSQRVSDTILIDTVKPTNGTVTAAGDDGEIALTWTGFADASSGIASYKVMQATGTTAPSTCTSGTPVYTGSAGTTTITGLTNGTVYAFRVCAVDNAGNVSTGATASAYPAPEYDPPTGTVSLNAAAAWANTTAVTATLAATDEDSSVTHACLSNTTTCTTWFTMTSSKAWTLTTSAGTKTVYAWFKDTYGNVSGSVNDTIGLDTTKPVNGTVTATSGDTEIELAWTGYSDPTSGVASYKVMQAASATAPANCTTGTAVYEGTATSATLESLTNGTTYSYRVCAVDTAGNVSTGSTASSIPAAETTAPTGTISLNAGAAWTNSTAATATLTATDEDSSVTEACLSNTTTCTTWFTMTGSKSWTLATGAGTKTVYAWFKDANGNISTVINDTIGVDTVKPVNGTVTAVGDDGEVALSWSGFTDASAGVASYKVMQAASATAPANCTTGTPVFDNTGTTTTLSGLTNGTTYSFRVCAVDSAGNVSTGATISVIPAPEYDAPVGTLSLNSAALWSTSSTVTAALSATDDSTVTHACLSNTTTCTSWFAMTATKSWTLASGAGTKTVYAWYKDTYGNISTVVNDTIGVDSTAPANGTVTATSGDTEIELAWTGYSDAGSAIASYKVMQSATATAPANCTTGTPVYTGTATSTTLSSLTNGTTYSYRVCAVDTAGNTSTGSTASAIPAAETTPPEGTISLNAGAAWTNSSTVTAGLTGTDEDSTVTEACLSNTNTCSAWFAMTASKSWTMATGAGLKTVFAWFKDANGNISAAVSDTISVDTVLPTGGTLTAAGDDAEVALSWSGFADASSGVASYKVMQAASATAPSTCTTGTPVYTGTATSTTITGLTNGTTYSFRVCAVDNAGNVAAGATASAIPAPEYDPPVGTLSLNSAATWTSSSSVSAALAATDDSDVTHACLSNTTTCGTWFAMTATKTWSLASGTGSKTVYAWYKDAYGNVSAMVSDAISVDNVVPVNGTITATPDDGEIALAWTGFSDASSGIASYKLMQSATATAPTNCTSGTPVYTGTGTSTTLSSLTNGTTYSFRVCAVDNAGNTSTGATVSAVPAAETTPPTGSISINSAAAWTNVSSVSVALTATDEDSDVTHACLSNTTSCTAWFAMTATKSWTLATGTGSKTVYGWYKDTNGNVSAMVSDAISVDTVKPVNGTLTATGDDGEIVLAWTGFTDASAGIASYKVMQATSATAPANCTTGTPVFDNTGSGTTLSGLTNGTTYSFRVCAVDSAGNISTGVTASAVPATEYDPPTGTISLNTAAAWANTTAVTAALTATDEDSTVIEACLSNTTTCTSWFAMTASKSWTLATGNGTKTVYAWFKDDQGNVSTVINDTIGLDTVKPTNGAVNVTAATGGANVSWTGYSDITSGIASYKLVYATGSAPGNCSAGTQGYAGTGSSTSLTGLTAGTTYGVRVCAIDTAGNMSTGMTGSFTAL